MRSKRIYKRLAAGGCILLGLFLTLVLWEAVYFLTVSRWLEGNKLVCALANGVWIYAGLSLYYQITRRYTKWWKQLNQ